MNAPALTVRRDPLVAAVGRRLRRRCGVPRGAGLVVAVSGGADSVALLLCCHALSARGAVETRAVHVHHHLRPGADEDATSVERLCGRLGVPCVVHHVRPEGGNVEAAARTLRYAALADAAAESGAGFIATAHHAGDQLECLLMALARGGGLNALSGMPWAGPVPGDEADAPRRLVRPLLDVPHEATATLCRAAGVASREDPTNCDVSRARACLRAQVLPVLERLWPGAATRAAGTADLVRTAAEGLDHLLTPVFGPPDRRSWPRDDLRPLPAPLVAAGLRRAALTLHGGPSDTLGRRALDLAANAILDDDRRPRRFDWPHGMVLEVSAHTVTLR